MSTDLSVTSRPRRRPDLWLRTSGDETVLVDPGHDAVHVLNATAVALWELCDGETAVEEMITAIVNLFDADEPRVRRDVVGVLGDMVAKGMLDAHPAPSGSGQ